MVLCYMLLVYGAYGYAEEGRWTALALFGVSITGIVLCEIRFQVTRLMGDK